MKAPQNPPKGKKQARKEEYKYEGDEFNDEFGGNSNNFNPPTMQKGYSESSDLFGDPSPTNNRGHKRTHQDDDVFNAESYKRFKHE